MVDQGAEMVDQLTSVWQRYARIALAVLGAIVVVAGVAYYTIQQNKAQENLASKKLAEAVLDDLVSATASHLKKGDKVRLTGLGIPELGGSIG